MPKIFRKKKNKILNRNAPARTSYMENPADSTLLFVIRLLFHVPSRFNGKLLRLVLESMPTLKFLCRFELEISM